MANSTLPDLINAVMNGSDALLLALKQNGQ